MKNELLILTKKHTDTLFEQTIPKPQKTLEVKLNKQMETFSFSPSENPTEEGKLLIAVTPFEATNSVDNITDKNNIFSNSTPSYCTPDGGEELNNKVNNLLELRFQNDSELHVKEVEKRGFCIEI